MHYHLQADYRVCRWFHPFIAANGYTVLKDGNGLPINTEGYDLCPSQLFKRNCHMVGWFDTTGMKTRSHIGLNSILWSTNFPLGTSTWPESRKSIARCFDGVPENERRQVLVDNTARVYQLA